jgi:hypothetical protein
MQYPRPIQNDARGDAVEDSAKGSADYDADPDPVASFFTRTFQTNGNGAGVIGTVHSCRRPRH